MPRYTVTEVAQYLHMSPKTLRSWLYGRHYPTTGGGTGFFEPLIQPADPTGNRLSFFNLVEAHILLATRQRDDVPMAAIRAALDYASGDPSTHPLITKDFLTEGRFLFEEKLGELVNTSKYGQLAFDPILRGYLERIDRDSVGYPMLLFPFVPNRPASKVVVIRPGVSSGVPTISGTGISIPILYGRYQAGDTIPDLADDYGVSVEEVGDAIAYLEAA